MFRWILKRDNDDHRQDKVNCSWFVRIEKQAVLTEAIMSFEDPRMDKKRCLQVMKKFLYILNQGQTFTKSEATTVLVAANKLFRFQDLHLKRLVYLIAKELCPIVGEVDILETSKIVEGLCNFNITFRANAIRLLCRSINGLSSFQTEFYLESAITDDNREVSIAGLVCAQLLLKKDPGIGIKVCEQVGKVASRSFGLRKFHALCLLFQMQQIEILGVGELARPHVDNVIFSVLKYDDRSKLYPLCTCLMLRYITQINRASDASVEPYPDYCKYIKSCIFDSIPMFTYKSDVMIPIEGLRAMKQLRNITSREVEAAKDEVRMRLRNSGDAVDWFGGFRAMHDQDEHEIQSYLEANDVVQVVKSNIEALATYKLYKLRRRVLQYYCNENKSLRCSF